MSKRKITIEDLARMVQHGFDATDKKMDKGFKSVDNHLDRIEKFLLKQHL